MNSAQKPVGTDYLQMQFDPLQFRDLTTAVITQASLSNNRIKVIQIGPVNGCARRFFVRARGGKGDLFVNTDVCHGDLTPVLVRIESVASGSWVIYVEPVP